MAKVGKPKLAKATRKPRVGITAAPKTAAAKAKKKPAKSVPALKAVSTHPPAQGASAKVTSVNGKKVSQKLLETIEKRRAQGKASSLFSRPPGRRGRRPKGSVEYTPEHQEEELFVADADQESLEYDTGIRVKQYREDSAFSLDRFEEFDEELNFDW